MRRRWVQVVASLDPATVERSVPEHAPALPIADNVLPTPKDIQWFGAEGDSIFVEDGDLLLLDGRDGSGDPDGTALTVWHRAIELPGKCPFCPQVQLCSTPGPLKPAPVTPQG